MGSIRPQLNTPKLSPLKALHTAVLQVFFNGVTDGECSSHQTVEHRQLRQFIPPLLGPEGLTALINLHQLLNGALMEINAQIQQRESRFAAHLHRR